MAASQDTKEMREYISPKELEEILGRILNENHDLFLKLAREKFD